MCTKWQVETGQFFQQGESFCQAASRVEQLFGFVGNLDFGHEVFVCFQKTGDLLGVVVYVDYHFVIACFL